MSKLLRNKIEMEDDLDERVVSISVERCWAVVMLFVIAIVIGVPAGVLTAQDMIGGSQAIEPRSLADLTGSWLMAIIACLMLGWVTLGRQVITISRQGIEITNRVLGIAFTRSYEDSRIRNLRVADSQNMTLFPLDSKGPFWNKDYSGLAFDYEEDSIHFAQYVKRQDAQRILAFLGKQDLQ